MLVAIGALVGWWMLGRELKRSSLPDSATDAGMAGVFGGFAGASFSEPVRLDDASALGRVDVQLMPDGSALATWIEFADGRGQLKSRRVQPGGQRSTAMAVASINSGCSSGYPRLARFGDEVWFAWTEAGDTPRVLTASAKVVSSSTAR